MKTVLALLSVFTAALYLHATPVRALDYVKKPALSTVTRPNTVFSSTQYTEWSSEKSQILQASPYFSYDARWAMNQPKLESSLARIDTILTQVKNTTDSNILANKTYFKNLASELLALEKVIATLEDSLSTVGDDAQLANIDLQNMLQKQQQTMQLMANVSKLVHDTAMAIIRKIG